MKRHCRIAPVESCRRQWDNISSHGRVTASDAFDHATGEIAGGSKLGLDATKKRPGEGFKRRWPPLTKMDATVREKIDQLFNR